MPSGTGSKIRVSVVISLRRLLHGRIFFSFSCSRMKQVNKINILYQMLKCMQLRLLEIIRPVQRIKPCIQEKLSPLTLAHDETLSRNTLFVLSQDDIHAVRGQGLGGLNDAIGRYDGNVSEH